MERINPQVTRPFSAFKQIYIVYPKKNLDIIRKGGTSIGKPSNFLDSKFVSTPPLFSPGVNTKICCPRKNVKWELKYTVDAVPIDLEFPGR